MTRRRLPSQIDNPQTVLRRIDKLSPLVAGRVVIACVKLDTQEVEAVECVMEPVEPQECWDQYEMSQRLCTIAESLAPERTLTLKGWSTITHVLVTVVCREGRVIPTNAEYRWLSAWRYSNHLTSAFNGDVYVVTPHGWTGAIDWRAGRDPQLRPRLVLAEMSDA